MNKRIRILAGTAGFCIAGNPEYVHAPRYDGICTEELEEFARLLVQECLDALDPTNDLTSLREEYGRLGAMNIIRQHFGAENV